MSQAANTFWDERMEGVGAAVSVNPVEKRRIRARRLVDGIILTIILAAAGTCVSVYSGASAELGAALNKHQVTGERVQDLTIRVKKLERDVDQLRNNPRVIELYARQKLGFVRSGDVVIKLPQEPVEAGTSATEGRRVANLTPRSGDGYTDVSN